MVVSAGLLQILQRLLTQRHSHLVPDDTDRDTGQVQDHGHRLHSGTATSYLRV